jgi:PAS domain S-box-containing protein
MGGEARQPGPIGLRRAIGLAAALLATLLALAAVELRREFARAAELRAAVERSYDTRLQIQAVFSLLQDAETGQRGYIITGDARFLEPYDRALTQLDAQLRALRRLFDADAAQTTDQRRLEAQIGRKRETMERSIARRDAGDAAGAMALVAAGEGKAAMDEIRGLVERMTQREASNLAALSTRAHMRTARTEISVALLFAAFAVTAAGAGFMLVRHLTTRGELLERLAAAAARHGATLDSAFDAIITLNPSGSIETLNPAAERMFGWTAAELGRRDISLLVDLAPDGEGSFLKRLSPDGQTLEAGVLREVTGRRRDGGRFPADAALGVMDLPTGRHVVAVIRDISERRRIEGMKDAFVSTVSHELRTPLTSIAGSLGLLAGGAAGALPDRAARLIAIAHANSQRLVRLINDILDVEKLESGQLVLALEPIDLRDVAIRSIEGVRGYADQLGVGLTLAGGDPAPVRGDADRLIQVVTNLLSNAAKFSPAGAEVSVMVAPEGRIARLSVTDNGPGVPEAFRSRIFGKFAQADATDTRAKGGTGLGLAIAREIAERHGGRLWYESAEGEGATFHLDLPLDQADLPAEDGADRVLICEDDPDAAQVLVELMRHEGYASDVARTAREALALARAGGYGAALIDLQLPDADGVGLIRALKAGEQTRATPVIVVSGDVARGRVRGRSLEVADWMEKPVDPARLKQAVRALVKDGRKPRVLHVDDDPDTLAVTRQALGAVELTGARSLAEARSVLERERPDLVILDLGLPDGSGLDLLPALTDDDGCTIPVVIYSAQELDREAAPAVQAVLTKSRMSLTQLARTVRSLTRRPGDRS